MSTLANAILRGAHSARPTDNSAGTEGRLYYETDTTTLFRDNGSSWDSVEGASSSGVARSGSTTDEHLAVWNGSDADSLKDGGAVPAGGSAEYPWTVQITPWLKPNATTGWTTALPILYNSINYMAGIQSSGTQNDYIEFKLLLAAGTWELTFYHYKNNNIGIFTVAIDGSSVGTVDGYASGITSPVLGTISGITVSDVGGSAVHLLRFTMATKNGSSSNYYGAFISPIQMRRTA